MRKVLGAENPAQSIVKNFVRIICNKPVQVTFIVPTSYKPVFEITLCPVAEDIAHVKKILSKSKPDCSMYVAGSISAFYKGIGLIISLPRA